MGSLTQERGRVLCWRWPLGMFISLSILWAGWYFITGNMPAVHEVTFDKNITQTLPFSIGAWWTVFLIPLLIIIMVRDATKLSSSLGDKFSTEGIFWGMVIGFLLALIVIFFIMNYPKIIFILGLSASFALVLVLMFTLQFYRVGIFCMYPLLFVLLHWGYGLLILGVMILVYFLFESIAAFVRSRFARICLDWLSARNIDVNHSTPAP